MITGIENELNNLEMIVKITKRRQLLYSGIINTPLGWVLVCPWIGLETLEVFLNV